MRRREFIAGAGLALAAGRLPGSADGDPSPGSDRVSGRLAASPSGHYFARRGRTVLLIGDSGTQIVPMNRHLDLRAWLDTCRAEGHSTVHVWAFTGPRPGDWRLGRGTPLIPWRRRANGRVDLLAFDEGDDSRASDHYWPRMRALCRLARDRGLLVGITVFFGWAKAGGPAPGWPLHPFHTGNGGFAINPADVVCRTDEREVHGDAWDEAWPAPRKAQWLWERFALKLVEVADTFGNVWFDYRDEWSYLNSEAAAAEPFWRRFFMRRGQLWADRSLSASFRVANPQVPAFGPTPAMKTEGEPYDHDGVRGEVWRRAMAGTHYLLHNDAREPNIATWDPEVARERRASPAQDLGRRYVGLCARFFNAHVRDLDVLVPAPDRVEGGALGMAAHGGEYVVYLPGGVSSARLDLRDLRGAARARLYDVRTGRWQHAGVVRAPGHEFRAPAGGQDWALLVQSARREGGP